MPRHAQSRPRPSVLMPAGLALTALGAGLLGGAPTALAADRSADTHPAAAETPLPPSTLPTRVERPAETETTAAIADIWPRGATASTRA